MFQSLAFWGLLLRAVAAQQSGNHPEWPRWCGKVYQPEYPSFDPGGWTVEPPELPGGLGLYLQFVPRYSIYLESESEGEFVVKAGISKWFGESWPNLETPADAPPVLFTINVASSEEALVSETISVGSTEEVFTFSFANIEPSYEPYEITLLGESEDGAATASATTKLYYLPEKETGSVARLDNLKGGLRFRNSRTDGAFAPLLPYGFFGSCDHFLCEDNSVEMVQEYFDLGHNGMIPLTTVFDSRPMFEFMDELGLNYMYDLRSIFQNLTEVEAQVSEIREFDALFGYWGSDEPDGWQHPLNSTVTLRDLLWKLDPYHPVTVTLNCQNYYFEEYTAGADFITTDVYPIGTNATFSKWGTECNTTYGDCGCDNCNASVMDVPGRFADFRQYEEWLGSWPKTKAHNAQSFGFQDYWAREPTPDEAVVMDALSLNHDAKSILSWLWPTSDTLKQTHGAYGKVVAKAPVRDFIVLEKAQRVDVEGPDGVEVAYWQTETEILVSVVNGGSDPVGSPTRIVLPEDAVPSSVKENMWGEAAWELLEDGIQVSELPAMSAFMVILSL